MPKKDHYGLGYKPSNYEKRREAEKRRVGRMSSFKGQRNDDEPMTFPPLLQTCRSDGYINPNLGLEQKEILASFWTLTINATEEDKKVNGEVCSAVHPCPSDFELNNWCSVKIPVVYKSTK